MRRIEYEGDKSKVYSTAGTGETFEAVLARRLSRRGLLRSAAAASALAVTGPRIVPVAAQEGTPGASPLASPAASPAASPLATPGASAVRFGFEAITLDAGQEPIVAAGHRVRPFLRWGDPLFSDLPEFDPANQTAAEQARRAGYNCDWIAFLPLPQGSQNSDHGLLCVNNEYTNPELMFPGYLSANPDYEPPASDDAPPDVPEFLANPTQEIVDVQLEAHGVTIVEVRRDEAGEWQVELDSPYNRRVTGTTPMEITGPAAGHELMRTNEDPDGTRVFGMLNNCAGGVTPWGTIVTGEENFQQYFGNLGTLAEDDPIRARHDRFGIPEESSERQWEAFHDRFDLAKEPNEPFRFGWGVEIDPYDPQSVPKKRTTIGRSKHEGHTSFVAPGRQVAIYTGDDERFEYAYKFVTSGRYDPDDRAANMDLLVEGTLYAARFDDDGTGEWLPLVHGEGPLTEENGFASQAEVLIQTRFAADAVGATKMDRPEDFETNPVTGKVYLVCTNNNARTLDETPAANPRPQNLHGHIIEITEDGDDHAATTFTWEMFLLAGDPKQGSTHFAGFDTELVSPISSPDNITFDLDGNLWISTDGMPTTFETNDGLFAVPTEGEERGYLRQFFSAVPGAEVSGPVFTPDNTSLFASLQHPGEDSSFEEPSTRWPDGGEMPPRPSVVVIQTEDGLGRVGAGTTRA